MVLRSLVAAVLLFMPTVAAQAQPPSPVPDVAAARSELAPNGRMRVAIAISTIGGAYWSTNDGGAPSGVPVDLGRELARRLGVPVDFVAYQNSGQITDAAARREWDVTFVPMDDTRAKLIHFGPVYNAVDATYIVRAGLDASTAAELDRPGIMIAAVADTTTMRSAVRSLKNAKVVGYASVDEIVALLGSGKVDAFAGSRSTLAPLSARLPGTHVLPGSFQQTRAAIAVPNGRPQAWSYAAAFMTDAMQHGFLRTALDQHGLREMPIPAP
ncbi:MAG TPA: transporter substrate-binding domain-containing protein [Candidatus Elarobacter sp.]|jgi:polar amino acid transport system substrate-binding protein